MRTHLSKAVLSKPGFSKPVSGKRIFVVESDQVIRSALKFILNAENETHVFPGIDQAFPAAERGKPDLVLLGLSIVRDRGLRVLNAVATRLPDTKILILSDRREDPLAQACLASGAHDVLSKPIANFPVRSKIDFLLGGTDLGWSFAGNAV